MSRTQPDGPPPRGRRASDGRRCTPRPDWAEPRLRFGDADGALPLAFAIGGLQGLIIMLGPHWTVAHPGWVVWLSVAAIAAAPVLWVLRRGLTMAHRHVLLATGTVMASSAIVACGANPSTVGVAYVYALVVLYAAAFLPARGAIAHLGGIGGCYALALALAPTPASPVQWLQAMAAFSVILVIVISFAQELRRSAAARTFALFHDPLTGLGNRALFLDRLDHALGSGSATSALLCVNIDDFRTINASVGKEAGDVLLAAIAGRLVAATRAEDTVARLGGDDFAVLVESGPMPETALAMARRIADTIAAPFAVSGVSVTLDACIGIAVADGADVNAAELLRDADVALHVAKKRGKGRIELVRPGMRDEALRHLGLIAELRHAVDAEEFELHYQAIVDADDGRPVGTEALVRWRHPTRGLVGPGEFIGLAETEGLIVPLGRWVLRRACRQTRQWMDAAIVGPDFHVSVNVSAVQLAQPSVVGDVAQALVESGLPPASLILEVTESALMVDAEAARDRLDALKALGVRIALDDFGTGYSSLNRLRHVPVDVLKVDKSFVDPVTRSAEDAAVVQTIITVGHSVGAVVVAEGVETADQLATLRRLGCDGIQGFLFARPEPAQRAVDVIARLAVAARRPAIRPLR